MFPTIYLCLLFFCGILWQEIFATLLDKDTKLSSDFRVRKRRVINHLPAGRAAIPIESVNYIVRILESNRVICAGAILSHYTVITAAPCTANYLSIYKIYSGGAGYTGYTTHYVTSRSVHAGNRPHEYYDGIALITVDPPFTFSRKTGSINLHAGPVPAGTMVTVFGWGNIYPLNPGMEMRKRLRSITLPIMSHTECHNIYAPIANITEKHICTYHEQQYCAYNDAGAPLVLNNKLVGIHTWKAEIPNNRNPDVFIDVHRPEYSEWIRENALLM